MTDADKATPRFGLVVVGDEILSGRRQDKHFPKVIELLAARGLQLSWMRVVPDDREILTNALAQTFASGDEVLCCGGIGATPDDHTRQAAAAALGLPLALHPEAEREITLRCAEMAAKGQGTADMSVPENQQRLQMGVYPVGADIVPNPFNRIPGFYIRRHTFVPGFPVMAWPMLEQTLDTRYADFHHPVLHDEMSFVSYGVPEARITPALVAVQERWPGVRAFSLPSVGEDGQSPHIELGVKGPTEDLPVALAFLREQAKGLGAKLEAPVSRNGGRIE
ncbi:competence/damage-inducible protein A [Orrella daihaiensis]|uniref:Competence/damage-inducible protein A n=1 Tax=Orrella daihaiensis TaxID=2782176 RepID=A0ABY4AM06_9BURK|nr:molybdopterin-binding protein [Orrella daihaiensis]UOD51346.1 competence/damage-inducible protein A [Orrella daihaiensis]